VCGCEDRFDYRIPDDLWKKVIPARYRNNVVCLACFDRFASEKRVDYAHALKVLYFAGERAAFRFQAVSAEAV
jgi:hypothetical protein